MQNQDFYTVEDAMIDRFRPGTMQRSNEYKKGFQEILELRLNKKPLPPIRHKEGTVEADAYFAGIDHGKEYYEHRKNGPIYD